MVLIVGSILGLLVLLATYLAYRSRQRGRQRLAGLELLRLQQERTIDELRIRDQLGRDMHDDLGAGLSALKLRSEMALRSETDPHRRQRLADIAERSGELIDNMRQLLWTMSNDQRSLEDLVAYAGSYARKYLSEHGIRADIRTSGTWPNILLTSEERRDLFLVLKEALHNVVKHAHADLVQVILAWDGRLHMTVKDNGTGTDVRASAGNGLNNMRQRIERLGGHFEVDNGDGTTLHCWAPLGSPPGSSSPGH
jgi:two-component system sensor histidine kinase DesK